MRVVDCFIVLTVAIFGQTVAWAADQVSQPSDGTTAAATVVSSSSRPVSPVLGGIALPVPRVGDSCTYEVTIAGGGWVSQKNRRLTLQVAGVDEREVTFVFIDDKDQMSVGGVFTRNVDGTFTSKGREREWPYLYLIPYRYLVHFGQPIDSPRDLAVVPYESQSEGGAYGLQHTSVTVSAVTGRSVNLLVQERFARTGQNIKRKTTVSLDLESQCIQFARGEVASSLPGEMEAKLVSFTRAGQVNSVLR